MTDKEALIKRLEVSCLGLDAVDPLRLLVNDVVAALRQTEQEPAAHQKWCASLTQLLLSMPPQPAPCNCHPSQRTKDLITIHTCTPPKD